MNNQQEEAIKAEKAKLSQIYKSFEPDDIFDLGFRNGAEWQQSQQPIKNETNGFVSVKVSFKDHEKIVIERLNGDSYTSSSEELMDFFCAEDKPSRAMTLEECKDQVARKHGANNWDNLCFIWAGFIKQIEPFMDEVAELFANQFRK